MHALHSKTACATHTLAGSYLWLAALRWNTLHRAYSPPHTGTFPCRTGLNDWLTRLRWQPVCVPANTAMRDLNITSFRTLIYIKTSNHWTSELWSGRDRRGNKSRFSSLMEGKAWLDAGRLAENDPNQSACLWEWNKTLPYLYLRLYGRTHFLSAGEGDIILEWRCSYMHLKKKHFLDSQGARFTRSRL